MHLPGQIRLFVLEALDRCADEPMPESSLIASVQMVHRHAHVGLDDCRAILRTMEADGLVSTSRDDVTEQTLYVLTPKGRAAYRARLSR